MAKQAVGDKIKLGCDPSVLVTGDIVKRLWLLLRHALVATAFGAATVVLPLGLNFIVFAIWIGTLIRQAWLQNVGKNKIAIIATQVATMTIVIVAAFMAPVKTTEHFLDRQVQLPNKELTITEIEEGLTSGLPPQWLARGIYIDVPADEQARVIAFPSTTITLREFVATVEAQTTLRHRFGHCGNGSTILWGGDCSFGLHIRRPN